MQKLSGGYHTTVLQENWRGTPGALELTVPAVPWDYRLQVNNKNSLQRKCLINIIIPEDPGAFHGIRYASGENSVQSESQDDN